MYEVVEHGTIERPCPVCGKTKIIIHGTVNNEQVMMCKNCMADKYKIGKRKKTIIKNVEICDKCHLNTLVCLTEETKVKNDFLIKTWQCSKCNNKRIEKVKLWRKKQ